jgi:gas vesicle protein
MRNPFLIASALLLTMIASQCVVAEESTLKEGAKKVGQETGEVVHKVAEGGKKAGKKVAKSAREVGHATRDAAKEVGKKVADTAVEVGHATRDGAKEFAEAVKDGASNDSSTTPTPHQHKTD